MRLIVDASEISRHDAGTGIQRVFHRRYSFLRERINNSEHLLTVYAGKLRSGYRICTLASAENGRHFFTRTSRRYKPSRGDVFFALDYQSYVQTAQKRFFARLKQQRIPVAFLVHDALPYTNPEWFPGNAVRRRRHWERYLELLSTADLLFAVSRTTAEFLAEWINKRAPFPHPRICVLPNGADLLTNGLKSTFSERRRAFLNQVRSNKSFLMVGTLEPRKGYPLVLDAFERIWQCSANTEQLIIVGKNGWSLSAFAERLRTHPESGRRLHWLTHIEDDLLCELYKSSSCLISASYGEGFGLPLAEAMAFGLPVLARDIPIFREIGGQYPVYFETDNSEELAAIISGLNFPLPSCAVVRSPSSATPSWRVSSESMLRDLLDLANGNNAAISQ